MQKRGFQTFIPRRGKRPITYDPFFIPPGEEPRLTRYQKQRLKRINRLEKLRKRS